MDILKYITITLKDIESMRIGYRTPNGHQLLQINFSKFQQHEIRYPSIHFETFLFKFEIHNKYNNKIHKKENKKKRKEENVAVFWKIVHIEIGKSV